MAQRPEPLSANILNVKGQADADTVQPAAVEGLTALGHKKVLTVTVTLRLEPERHLALKRAALDYGTTIQDILTHALTQIGL